MALPVELSRRLAAGIRAAELLGVPRVGHLSNVEAPVLLTQAIERFVDLLAMDSQRAV
jgi:pimeloyl-ACP methyl ester carboxylesterase